MNHEQLERLEREILGWPGVCRSRNGHGPAGIGVTRYMHGESQIGHVHDGFADFSFPPKVRDELIRSGKAIAHPAFPNSR